MKVTGDYRAVFMRKGDTVTLYKIGTHMLGYTYKKDVFPIRKGWEVCPRRALLFLRVANKKSGGSDVEKIV